jgi:hypothetical protein
MSETSSSQEALERLMWACRFLGRPQQRPDPQAEGPSPAAAEANAHDRRVIDRAVVEAKTVRDAEGRATVVIDCRAVRASHELRQFLDGLARVYARTASAAPDGLTMMVLAPAAVAREVRPDERFIRVVPATEGQDRA